ncbi:hypothetical protein ACIAD3293 [Acinetobacter baylyi ADP1]|uniref:Uncharacterized protein n=1 Tax=Acinetobacter baylyi (strain ATCC 33305 / BD413 / ADP1) TaxID=62977 RepID=Q6F7J7_ACIAD|nr:hypothetical protein ACIAD3293 [Acinetobacter baylyi ADP1]
MHCDLLINIGESWLEHIFDEQCLSLMTSTKEKELILIRLIQPAKTPYSQGV